MDNIVHFKIHIFGKVQGVFFRANTLKKAIELNLVGFVCNQPDGSVYVAAEGLQEKMQTFLAWCQHGDLPARVDKVDFEEASIESYKQFEILR